MLSMYTSYKCRACGKEFVLLSEDVSTMAKDRYIGCPYCSSKRVQTDKVSDSVKECMNEHSYRRCNGRVKQTR